MGRHSREDKILQAVLKLIAILTITGMVFPWVRQMLPGLLFMVFIALCISAIGLIIWLLKRSHKHHDTSLKANYFPTKVSRFSRAVHTQSTPVPFTSPNAKKELLKKLRTIDWFQFEKVVAAIYDKAGYHVTRFGGANPDGGIDLIIEKNGHRTGIQCKHWKTWKVNVRGIREFLGALTHSGLHQGLFITLQGCTQDARQLAHAHNIKILDEGDLAKLLDENQARFDPDFIALLSDQNKNCPKCEAKMLLRTARKGSNAGGKFWGCSRYPACHYIVAFSS